MLTRQGFISCGVNPAAEKGPKVKTHTEPLHWVTSNGLTGHSGELVSYKQLDWYKPTIENEYVLEKWCTNKLKD